MELKLSDPEVRQAKFDEPVKPDKHAIDNGAKKKKPNKRVDGNGLYLQITKTGSKYWRYDYKHNGKRKTMAYGVYPDVSLKRARELHQEAKTLLADGHDPMAIRKEKEKTNKLTFRVVAERWFRHWKTGVTASHANSVWHRLNIDVLPAIGDMPVNKLNAVVIRDCIKSIEARGALDIAKRQLQKCGQIMRYAVANGLAERNPVADIQPSDILPSRKKRNYNRIETKDLPKLLLDIDNYTGSEYTRLALQLMVLTFVRTGELIGAVWSEIDLDGRRWNIPAERMKMHKPHIVPLSDQAIAVLEKLISLRYQSNYIFPADNGKPTHMSNNTILYALYRMGYRGRMTGHGFRGIASTILHEQGWPHEHIELQLAHQSGDDVSAAYNHAKYLKPRAELMQSWADYLDALKVKNVIALRSA